MLKFKASVLCCPVLFSEEDELLGTLHRPVSFVLPHIANAYVCGQ